MNSYMQIIRQKHSGRIPVLLSEKGNFFVDFCLFIPIKLLLLQILFQKWKKQLYTR